MTIKQLGGVFGRNPTFNDVTIEGQLTFDGDIDIDSDLKVDGDLEVTGLSSLNGGLIVNTPSSAEIIGVAGDSLTLTAKSGDATAANNAGGGFRNIGSATATSRSAQMWLDADGANLGGGDYFYMEKKGNSGDLILSQYSNADMIFRTNGDVEAARFTSTGNLAFPSGQGIDFSATAGTGTSELLADYEEGVWTPLISQDGDGAVPFTSVTQSGAYTKVGNLVTVTCLYEYSGIGSVGNNFAYMGGLPFTAADNSIYGYGFSFFEQSAYDTKSYSIAALSNAAKAFFQYDNGGGTLYVGTPRMVGNTFPSAAKVRFTLTYIAA